MAVRMHRTRPHAVVNLRRQRRQRFPVAGHVNHRRPLGHHRHRRWPEFFELDAAIDNLAIDNGQHRLDPLHGFVFDVEIIRRQRDQVCQLPDLDLAFLALLG
ncbi:hypothetical protein D3C87_1852210 [compost metagenome]